MRKILESKLNSANALLWIALENSAQRSFMDRIGKLSTTLSMDRIGKLSTTLFYGSHWKTQHNAFYGSRWKTQHNAFSYVSCVNPFRNFIT
ncbi:hypothetical protein [Leptospira interrogans]|uniref:hypothetical protein n=1 Tax=Leptospira interrogans TaxID=173 RepID=UPI00034BB44E|nr:hypothetical protein [Leptospira interrogans]